MSESDGLDSAVVRAIDSLTPEQKADLTHEVRGYLDGLLGVRLPRDYVDRWQREMGVIDQYGVSSYRDSVADAVAERDSRPIVSRMASNVEVGDRIVRGSDSSPESGCEVVRITRRITRRNSIYEFHRDIKGKSKIWRTARSFESVWIVR